MYCIGAGDLDRDNDVLAAWVLIIKTAEGLDGANESEGGGVGGEEKEVETKSVVRNIVTPLNSKICRPLCQNVSFIFEYSKRFYWNYLHLLNIPNICIPSAAPPFVSGYPAFKSLSSHSGKLALIF